MRLKIWEFCDSFLRPDCTKNLSQSSLSAFVYQNNATAPVSLCIADQQNKQTT